jgi:3-phenylpropionate/cinnamic acid dioxygenase small subunit
MADKQAISEILGKMGWAYDSGNLDYLETVYTDDARFTISIAGMGQVGEYQTKTTIMGLYRGAKAGQTDTRRHVVSNIFLAEDAASTATAVSYLSLFVKNAEGVKLLSTGEYTDKFVLVGGAWKIVHRNLALDAPY